MTEEALRPPELEPYLRGCAWPAAAGWPYPRCDPGPSGLRLPEDTRGMARVPAGVRFVFAGEPAALEVTYRTETDELGYRGPGAGTTFSAWRGDACLDEVPAVLGDGTARVAIGSGEGPVTLHLPEGMKPVVLALRPEGGDIAPAPPEPRWLCYGDSIAEGWCASGPAGAWPHVVARRHGIDVVNLAYAGAARGELPSAEEIAGLPADLISISHGTNCWTRTPHSADLFEAGLEAFLDLVREGHPETPIVAISPILRADAEETPNPLGATLADLRAAFERVAMRRLEAGDRRLVPVPGAALVPADEMPDGIHPGDAGHERMAAALGPILRAALTMEAP